MAAPPAISGEEPRGDVLNLRIDVQGDMNAMKEQNYLKPQGRVTFKAAQEALKAWSESRRQLVEEDQTQKDRSSRMKEVFKSWTYQMREDLTQLVTEKDRLLGLEPDQESTLKAWKVWNQQLEEMVKTLNEWTQLLEEVSTVCKTWMQDFREQRDKRIRVAYLGLALYIVLGGIFYGVLFGVVQPYPLQCRDIWSPIFVYLAPCFSIVINIITLRLLKRNFATLEDGEEPDQMLKRNFATLENGEEPGQMLKRNFATLEDGEEPGQTPEKNHRVITRLDVCLLLLLAMVVGCLTRLLCFTCVTK